MINQIILGDCLEVMKVIPDKSIDAVICDLPYAVTNCSWDSMIPLDLLWDQYKRVVKDDGPIVLFGRQPFTSALIMSNLKMFRYELIWEKDKGSNPLLANIAPMQAHENIVVFYKKKPTYNPQWTYGEPYTKIQRTCTFGEVQGKNTPKPADKINEDGRRFPKSVIKMSRDMNKDKSKSHPTQKPLKLIEWLIKTYTNEGDLILDNTAGSGTLGVACLATNRNYILIEKEQKYYDMIINRLNK